LRASGVPGLVWTPEALDDLQTIVAYIADRNPVAAENLQAHIDDTAQRLVDHPLLYRPGRITGTREAVVHPNYILIYRAGVEVIEVLAVVHARRRYP
jgi:toxin ParE1/3/4